MTRKTFVSFGLVVLVLAVVIPWLAFRSRGDAARTDQKVPASLVVGQEIFQTNCGTCHTLYAAGTDGNFAPDLDELLSPSGPAAKQSEVKAIEERVLNAVHNGVDSTTTPGRMPPGVVSGEQAEQVAEFVARTAGES